MCRATSSWAMPTAFGYSGRAHADVLTLVQDSPPLEERVKDAISQGVNPVEAHERVNYDRMTQQSR